MANVEKGEIRTQRLPVELTPEEVILRSREAVAVVQEHRDQEQRLEDLTAGYKTAKEQLQEEIAASLVKLRALAEVVRNAREDRIVEVYDEIDAKAQKVNTIRADTKAIVGTRGMTDAERQRSLFKGVEPKVAAGGEGKPGPRKAGEKAAPEPRG